MMRVMISEMRMQWGSLLGKAANTQPRHPRVLV